MAKQKNDQAVSKPEGVQAAPDDETRPDVNIVQETTPEAPAVEVPEPQAPAATQALPVRPDSRAKTSPGNTTRPIPVEMLELAENRDRALLDEDTKTNHIPASDRVTGPIPEEARTPKYTTTPLPLETKRSKTGMAPWTWALLGALSALLMAGAIWFFFLRTPDTPSTVSIPEPTTPEVSHPSPTVPEVEVPPALRPYMEKAKKGDAKAMAMLAVMYDNGLNVKQNKIEGRKWYEKAAAAGNASAKKWLEENPKK